MGKIEVSTENEHTRLQERHAQKMHAAEERRKGFENKRRKSLQDLDKKRKLVSVIWDFFCHDYFLYIVTNTLQLSCFIYICFNNKESACVFNIM